MQDFTQGIVEIQTLQSKCKSEIRRREALESTVNTLKSGVFRKPEN